ncbi:hypothetical protein [Streptomyces sp. NPDC102462]|uniref:hypothetical protein n=1 Tax=Streptomyces sp. NPDC102462 TaxID=3366178 RepID=UPI003828941B
MENFLGDVLSKVGAATVGGLGMARRPRLANGRHEGRRRDRPRPPVTVRPASTATRWRGSSGGSSRTSRPFENPTMPDLVNYLRN